MRITSGLSTEILESDGDLFFGAGAAMWNGAAPQSLRKHYRVANDDEGWRRWTKHLARRRKPRSLTERFVGQRSPLVWAWPDELATEPPDANCPLALAAGDRRLKPKAAAEHWTAAAQQWLDRTETSTATVALEALSWAYELPKLAPHLPARLWWQLLTRLVTIADQAGGIDLEAQPLVNQLLAGELPLVLAYQFPELKPAHQLAPAGAAALSRGVGELLDGEGLPHGRHLAIFRPLMACWTRARSLAGKATWDSQAEKQFAQAVLELVRLSRGDGRQPLTTNSAGAWCPKLVKQALRLVKSDRLDRRARLLLPLGRGGAKLAPKPNKSAAVRGEWAELAVLQPGWHRGGPKLTVNYGNRSVRMELEVGGEVIWSGPWQFELHAHGKAITIDSDWEEVCWVSDADADYVEIEAELTDGFVVQRQIALARKDRLLLLADAIIGPADQHSTPTHPSNRLTYAGTLPLAEGIQVKPAAETRELWLSGDKQKLAVLPLALPEWRSEKRAGELAADGSGLVLRQSTLGRNLYAPLLVDLDRQRSRCGLTWRHLTVAEDRKIQPAEAAVGFRAQIGREQWLVYRSLVEVAGRTVLGQNLGTEFLLANFRRDGTIERLVEIE
jgi:hypothetical protein